MLIQMNKCKRVLEIGTFAAYSTIWLGRALPEDGYLLTIEGRATHAEMAQKNIDHANLPVKLIFELAVLQISFLRLIRNLLNLLILFSLMQINRVILNI